jgi:nucleoside-diphosphate-sugar epimerase
MTEPRLTVGVTGASGFIGRHAVARFAARGHAVRAFQRPAAAPPPAGVATTPFDVREPLPPGALDGLDVLVHGALVEYGPRQRDADRVNRDCAARLIAMARASGTHLIFLSTLSAHDRARSHYGRSKLEIERLFDPALDTVLRLGLVLGRGGLFGSMVEMIRASRVIPLPDGGRQPIQTLWMEDLLDVLERAAARRLAGRYDLATARVYTMRDLYRAVIDGLGVRRTLIPVPLALVGAGVAVLETLRVPFGIHSENVLGLRQLRAFDNAGDLAALGLEPLSLEESVARLLRGRTGATAARTGGALSAE